MTALKSSDGAWVRSDALVRAVGDDIFVAEPDRASIHALNAMASAAWRALEEPRTLDELCALFEAAFPGIEAAKIRGDLCDLLAALEEDGLVSHVKSAPASDR